MDIPLDLTCWYQNARRIMELVGAEEMTRRLSDAARLGEPDHMMRRQAEQAILKSAVTGWLRQNKPLPLGKLITEGNIKTGIFFTHYEKFYCRGLSKVQHAIDKGHTPPMAEAYSKLEDWMAKGRLSCKFSHEHLTSSSAWHILSGQQRLMVLGFIEKIEDDHIHAIPYIIAHPFCVSSFSGSSTRWGRGMEVYVDDIDSFNRVQYSNRRRSNKQLELLKKIPEKDIKSAFAEIIGEPTVPKDWGGEKSDLFSSCVQLDGRRVSTAFVFKGPSQFKPMTMAELGKNGDQIDRLYTEPADLLVLQHCHEITPSVRNTMRAYAQQVGRPRLCCMIDGYDTIRILEAYGKCGFSQETMSKCTDTVVYDGVT